MPTAIDPNFPQRNLPRFPVTLPASLPNAGRLTPHRLLKEAIIEEFLPRFGYGAEVLYVSDSTSKCLVRDEARLKALDLFEPSHGEIPDIVAYSSRRRWLYLIEAGPISPNRHLELARLTARCKTDIVYVSAFLNREAFRKFCADISWETEVWIAEAPDHIIHFNGGRFLGPHPDVMPKFE